MGDRVHERQHLIFVSKAVANPAFCFSDQRKRSGQHEEQLLLQPYIAFVLRLESPLPTLIFCCAALVAGF